MTKYEQQAREVYAEICHQKSSCWEIIRNAEPNVWYDFMDPETGKYGQCCKRADGTWKQKPLGENPVILSYLR